MAAATRTLTEARKALAEALGAPAHVPEVIDPPTIVIEPGEPYLAHARDFGWREYLANVHIYVLVAIDDNADMADNLDTALLAAMDAVDGAGWSVEAVGKPGIHFTADWTAYGVRITATGRILRPEPAPEGTP